jgi:hypothetical protein
MAVISFTIPDAVVNRVLDAFAKRNNYSPFMVDGKTPNPETKGQFMKRVMGDYVKATVIAQEAADAADDAARTAETNAGTQIQIT